MRYDTPEPVAVVLARHTPRSARTILEPAVGCGALLRPVINRCKGSVEKVVCVDTDSEALRTTRASLAVDHNVVVDCVHADFLAWSSTMPSGQFDCVVTNPPFAGSMAQSVAVDMSELGGLYCGEVCLPLELAFICRSIRMLKDGGRVLAIAPSCLVSGEKSGAFREALLRVGALRYVHELPPFTFPKVEARMYLLVFDKARRQRASMLCNHDLYRPEGILVPIRQLQAAKRLDFRYFRALERYEAMRRLSCCGWTPLSSLASIRRGVAKSPEGVRDAVHTCDYRSGFWRRSERHGTALIGSRTSIQAGDILIKRVGRLASQTAGPTRGLVGLECTDCVFALRPVARRSATALLFTIRCLFGYAWLSDLIEKGSGASYITQHALETLSVPSLLHERFPQQFRRYSKCARRGQFGKMQEIEACIQDKLERLTLAC